MDINTYGCKKSAKKVQFSEMLVHAKIASNFHGINRPKVVLVYKTKKRS